MKRKMRLQSRLSLLLGVVVLFVVTLSVTVFSWFEGIALKEEVHRELLAQTRTISRRIGQLFYSSNWRFLLVGLQNDRANQPDIVYFFLTDVDGTILLAHDTALVGSRDPVVVQPTLDPDRIRFAGRFVNTASGFPDNDSFRIQEIPLKRDVPYRGGFRGRRGDRVFDTWWQVAYGGKALGHLRIGYSRSLLLSRLHRLQKNMLAAGVLLSLGLMLAGVLLVRRGLRPVVRLREALVDLNTGDVALFRERLERFSPLDVKNDTREIEDLRIAFDRMRCLLIRNWAKDDRYRAELEGEVERRTGELQAINRRLMEEVDVRQMAEDRLRRQNEYLEALHETVLGVVGRLEVTELFDVILARAGKLMDTPHGFLMIRDESSDVLKIAQTTGLFNEEKGACFRPGEGLSGRSWKLDRPMIVDDYASWPHAALKGADWLHSTLVVPLRETSGSVGVIGFGYEDPTRRFDDADQAILCRFAELAGIALSNAHLHTALQSELDGRRRAERENRDIQQQLFQAQKLEAIGKLAGGIAHDINNLLMAIQGHLSLMVLRRDAEGGDAHLRHMESLVESGSRMTRQLLGFARGGKYETRPTDVAVLVENTLDLYSRTRKDLVARTALAEDLAVIEVDRVQIEQVLMNLLVNAAQAMPKGGELFVVAENAVPDEALCTTRGLSRGPHVRIGIRDTGEGMSSDVMERIFDPFFTTRETGRGTGLGLSSAYGIMRNHGGCIEVESRPGKGSTFTLWLPASPRPVVAGPQAAGAVPRGTETLLVVDDEEKVRTVTVELLTALGYTVLEARDGAEALALHARNPGLDLVLLDLVMPRMGGADVFEAMMRQDPGVRVLLVSGYSIDGVARELLSMGAVGFLQKPFDMGTLARRVREAIR